MRKFKIFAVLLMFCSTIQAQKDFVQTGNASIIGDKFVGRYTANGEKYSHDEQTAAHLTLPFGTLVKVVNLNNSKSVTVRINDRGPFAENRIIDLSKSAADKIGFTNGVAKVRIEVIDKKEALQPDPAPGKKEASEEETGRAFYEIKSKSIQPSGFGVQIASYREPSNLLRLAHDIENNSGFSPIVEIAENEGIKTYRLIVGNFTTRKEAEAAQDKLKKDFPQCFVITF